MNTLDVNRNANINENRRPNIPIKDHLDAEVRNETLKLIEI